MDVSELPSTGLIAELDEDARSAIAAVMHLERHGIGTPLVIEGSDATKFYVLVDGHATVHRQGAHVTDLGPGDVIGELGVVSLKPRNATVLATTEVVVAVAMGWDVRSVIDEQPDLRARLDELTARRTS